MLRIYLIEKHPKEETLTPMIDEYVPMDPRNDELYERFMEQRFQKLNKPEQSGMENSPSFPIEPLRTTLVTIPQKRVSNTSSVSGVNSPHALSPEMPVTPKNSQPHLIPSNSQMNPLSGPLTPFQQIIKNSQKSKNQELKYNRSQPDHPDLQSVLQNCTRQGYKI